MFEPDILSVEDLALRWKITQQQVIMAAAQLRVPLYFAFEGLAFDANDQWLRHGKDFVERRKFDTATQTIEQLERQLQRRARGQLSEWEELSSEEAQRNRQTIDEKKGERDRLEALLDDRDDERRKHAYRGFVRIGVDGLSAIFRQGDTSHPRVAFPLGAKIAVVANSDGRGHDGELYWQGPMLRLEPLPGDASSWKPRLSAADLYAFTAEVEAIEARQATLAEKPAPQGTAPASEQQSEAEMQGSKPKVIEAPGNWRMQVRDAATEWASDRLKAGKSTKKIEASREMEIWCRNNSVRTDTGVHPDAEYIRRHILNTWSSPR